MTSRFLTVGVFAACAAVTTAEAKVLIRYKFENTKDANGQLVVKNIASGMEGKYDAKVVSYAVPSSSAGMPTWGADAANMPVYTEGFKASAPHMIVQSSDGAQDHEASGGALKWDGQQIAGGLLVDDASAPLRLGERTASNSSPKFTVEAMIRLDPAAANRTADAMFPILQIGNDMQRGFLFAILNGRPFFRSAWKKSTGGFGSDGGSYGYGGFAKIPTDETFPSLYDGRWHHIALTYNDANGQTCARVYLDGSYAGANRWSPSYEKSKDFDGIYYGSEGDAVPVIIGAQPYGNPSTKKATRTFWGEIAEIRITDSQISENRFIVPGATGPVDDDTAVMIRFGENTTEGFGFEKQGVYRFYHDSVWNTFAPKNWGLRNAAYKNALQPRWYPYEATATNDVRESHRTADDAPGSVVRANLTTVESFGDGHSLALAPHVYNGVNVGDCINVPEAYKLPEGGDFTVEVCFRSTATDTKTLLGMPQNGFLSKLCVHQNGLLCRLYSSSGSNLGDMSAPNVNDGKWHHAAIVYRKHATPANSVSRYYVDSKLIAQRVGALRVLESSFLIGGYERNDQPFAGAVDNFRITRRALEVGEFLSAVPDADVTKNCLEATFDDAEHPYAAGRVGVADGVTAPANTSVPESVEIVSSRRGSVHDGEIAGETTRLREGGKAVKVTDSYVYWNHMPMMERDVLTVEYFARMTSNSTKDDELTLVSVVAGDDPTAVPLCCLCFSFPNSSVPYDRFVFRSAPDPTLQNVGGTARLMHAAIDRTAVFDNKWHHWAVVMDGSDRSKVKMTVYRDYEVVATGEDKNHDGISSWIDGALNYPKSGKGCGLLLGHRGSSTGLTATYDDVRVSPGVLPVEKMLHFEKTPSGMTVIFR